MVSENSNKTCQSKFKISIIEKYLRRLMRRRMRTRWSVVSDLWLQCSVAPPCASCASLNLTFTLTARPKLGGLV